MLFQSGDNICVIDQKLNVRNIELKKFVKGFPVLRRIFSLCFQKFDLNVSDFILSFNSFLFITKFIIIRLFNFKLKRGWFSKAFITFSVSLPNQISIWIKDKLMALKKRKFYGESFCSQFLLTEILIL
jgi:hypothetical protein